LGTPLQAQILDGHRMVKHRLVKVSYPELKDRSYCHEVDMSLHGSMDDVLDQMRATSVSLFNIFLDDYPNVRWKRWPHVQNKKAPRLPENSRIKDVGDMTTKQLYDFCRMLEGPYPRAFIEDEYGVLTIEKVSFKAKP
jgi:hypothetical protein